MASILSAGTTSATAMVHTADTSGVLQLASNNGVVALTIDASKRVGIGTTSPITTGGSVLELSNNANCIQTITCTNDTTSLLDFRTNGVDRLEIQSSSNWGAYFLVRSNQIMKFGINNAEIAQFDTSGNLTVGIQANTNASKISQAVTCITNTAYSTGRFAVGNTGGSETYLSTDTISTSVFSTLGSDSGGNGWKIRTYSSGYSYRFEFNANGAAYNSTGTWGTISDARVKQDIVDANSAWSDIKALAFKKYRLKSDVSFESSEENIKGFVAPTLFGLVAQDVQKTSPGLVEETVSNEVEDGKLLAIKTSVLLMKATKALQEAMERIEILEAKVGA